jgi:hypothetical protein
MKPFKEYLLESKQTYEFKVKIAGDCPPDCAKKIKEALSRFKVESCSAGKSTPIQETQVDFPEERNVGVTLFDVTTAYPATSAEVQNEVGSHCNVPLSRIKVRNLKEQEEEELNHANDESSGEALLDEETLEEVDGQKLVGDKHVMSLLKELGKNKTIGTQVKGTNDKILAKKSPSEKSVTVKTDKKAGVISPVGSKKITKPDVKSARG